MFTESRLYKNLLLISVSHCFKNLNWKKFYINGPIYAKHDDESE